MVTMLIILCCIAEFAKRVELKCSHPLPKRKRKIHAVTDVLIDRGSFVLTSAAYILKLERYRED